MPGYDDVMSLETQSQRLGTLWRRQGQAFLDEQAAELQEDVSRLRDAYVKGAAVPAAPAEPAAIRPLRRLLPKREDKVIDLREPARDPEIKPGWVCSKDGHFLESAVARCSRCHDIFCDRCIIQTEATQFRPVCMECALVLGGVHHTRKRPLRVAR